MTKSWDPHKGNIYELYKVQNKPLREVRKIMKERFGFLASTRAYRGRFDRWGWNKYNSKKSREQARTKTDCSTESLSPEAGETSHDSAASASPKAGMNTKNLAEQHWNYGPALPAPQGPHEASTRRPGGQVPRQSVYQDVVLADNWSSSNRMGLGEHGASTYPPFEPLHSRAESMNHYAAAQAYPFDFSASLPIPELDPAVVKEFHDAMMGGDCKTVKALLERRPNLVNSPDSQGWTPLQNCIRSHYRKLEIVKMLRENNADTSAAGPGRQTVLHLALGFSRRSLNPRFIPELLSCKSATQSLSQPDERGKTPLHVFFSRPAWWEDKETVDQFIHHKPDMNLLDSDQYSPLHLVVLSFRAPFFTPQVKAITECITDGADLKTPMQNDRNPFNHVVTEVIQHLGSGQAQAFDQKLWPAIASLMRRMVVVGAEVNEYVEGAPYLNHLLQQSMRPYAYGLLQNFMEILLERADPGLTDAHGNTALHAAVRERDPGADQHTAAEHRKAVEKLLAKPADLNTRGSEGRTPLELYAHLWHTDQAFMETVIKFLDRDANTDNLVAHHHLHLHQQQQQLLLLRQSTTAYQTGAQQSSSLGSNLTGSRPSTAAMGLPSPISVVGGGGGGGVGGGGGGSSSAATTVVNDGADGYFEDVAVVVVSPPQPSQPLPTTTTTTTTTALTTTTTLPAFVVSWVLACQEKSWERARDRVHELRACPDCPPYFDDVEASRLLIERLLDRCRSELEQLYSPPPPPQVAAGNGSPGTYGHHHHPHHNNNNTTHGHNHHHHHHHNHHHRSSSNGAAGGGGRQHVGVGSHHHALGQQHYANGGHYAFGHQQQHHSHPNHHQQPHRPQSPNHQAAENCEAEYFRLLRAAKELKLVQSDKDYDFMIKLHEMKG